MAWWLEYLPQNHEDLCSNTQNYVKPRVCTNLSAERKSGAKKIPRSQKDQLAWYIQWQATERHLTSKVVLGPPHRYRSMHMPLVTLVNVLVFTRSHTHTHTSTHTHHAQRSILLTPDQSLKPILSRCISDVL